MFRKEIKPLSESMIDAIGNTINKLEYVEEKEYAKKGDKVKKTKEFGDDEIYTVHAVTDKGITYKKNDKLFSMRNGHYNIVNEEIEVLDESKALLKDYQVMKAQGKKDSSIMDVLMSMPKYKKMSRDQMAKVIGDAKRKGIFKEEVEGLEEADANSIGQALMKKYGEGSKVVKKSGRYYIKYTKNNNEVIIGPFNDLDDVMKDLKEEVDLDESYTELSILKKRIARDTKKMKSLPDFHPQKKKIAILVAKDKKRLDDLFKKQLKNEEFELEEKMDPVGKADADIDNDGDVDSSDKYLHARRKAISKAMKKRKMNEQDTKMGTITVNSDEERKKRAAAYRAKKMKSEEVELDEAHMDPKSIISQINFHKDNMKIHDKKSVSGTKNHVQAHSAAANAHKEAVSRLQIAHAQLSAGTKDVSYYVKPAKDMSNHAIKLSQKANTIKEEVELDEAKSATGYTIYHKTFSSAVQHAISQVEKQGYTVDEDEWDRKVAMGPKKPSAGKTNIYTIPLLKNGKPTPRKLQMQVYYDEGRYELNMYIS